MQYRNKNDTSDDSGNWDNLKVVQKIPEQRIGKAVNQGIIEINRIYHSTHTHTHTHTAKVLM